MVELPKDTIYHYESKDGMNMTITLTELVRCHDCKNYEEAKNGVNGFCKEWQTSTYTWEWCARGERRDEVKRNEMYIRRSTNNREF